MRDRAIAAAIIAVCELLGVAGLAAIIAGLMLFLVFGSQFP